MGPGGSTALWSPEVDPVFGSGPGLWGSELCCVALCLCQFFKAFSFPLQAFLLSAFYFPLLFGGPLSGIHMEM